MSEAVAAPAPTSARSRVLRAARLLGALLAAVIVADLLGIDVLGWVGRIWDRIAQVDPTYIVVACVLKTGQTALTALALRNVMRPSFPEETITYRFAFGTYAAQAAGNAVLPAKGGTLIVLGLWRISIPKSTFATLIAILAVNSLAFSVFAGLTTLYVLVSRPEGLDAARKNSGLLTWIGAHPWLSAAIAIAVITTCVLLARRYWPRARAMLGRLAQGAAILRSPGRYLVQVVLPQLLSLFCRWGFTGVLMAGFGIPVTLRSVLLVIASSSLSGAVQLTPGGLGTRQALDCVALEEYASCTDVTAYSLSQQAISTAWTLVLGVVGLTWAFGWSRTKELVRTRSEIIARVRADQTAEAPAAVQEDETS